MVDFELAPLMKRYRHRLTDDELQYIKENCAMVTKAKLAKNLRVSEHCIEYAIRKHGWGTRRLWTQQEDEQVLQGYDGTNCWQLAEQLGRTPDAIKQRFAVLKKKQQEDGSTGK